VTSLHAIAVRTDGTVAVEGVITIHLSEKPAR